MIGFKEIIWDTGMVWLVLFAMTVGFALKQLMYIMEQRKNS
jgi:hypothetical protein